MRSNKELLQVFLDNQHLFRTGLCMWTLDLRLTNNLISRKEYNYLVNKFNMKWHSRLFILILLRKFIFKGHWWKPCIIEPRIKFLKKHLS